MITFPSSYIAAALKFAGDKDVRFYLNGVCVEATPDETRLVGCDGLILGVVKVPGSSGESVRLIIPRATVKMALLLKRPVLELHKAGETWYLSDIPFTPVDGTYPDYRRIIPDKVSGEAGNSNPALLSRFVEAGKLLKLKSYPIVRQNSPSGPALVHFYAFDAFVGVAMPFAPFNAKSPDLGYPTWGPK